MRIIFNTSYIVAPLIEYEWTEFMRENYIKYIKINNLAKDLIFTKVSIDQPDGKTYSFQLVFDSQEEMDIYMDKHQVQLDQKLIDKYKNRYICFSSVLTEI